MKIPFDDEDDQYESDDRQQDAKHHPDYQTSFRSCKTQSLTKRRMWSVETFRWDCEEVKAKRDAVESQIR